MNKYLFITLITLFICKEIQANLVVIECTFPCSTQDEICEVTSLHVKCTQRTNKTK
jgi:hypothetical protein